MIARVNIDTIKREVHINGLTSVDPDLVSLLLETPEERREIQVLKILSLGTAVWSRVDTATEVDYVERRFETTLREMERAIDALKNGILKDISERIDPSGSGSVTRGIVDLVDTTRKELKETAVTLEQNFRRAKEELERGFDPNQRQSYAGQMRALIEETHLKLSQMFDPNRKESYFARLQDQLEALFGGKGRVAEVLDEKMRGMENFLRNQVEDLKKEIAVQRATLTAEEKTPLHGYRFEDQVREALEEMAKYFGDTVEDVSTVEEKLKEKAGDFVVSVNGRPHRIVVEARARQQISLSTTCPGPRHRGLILN